MKRSSHYLILCLLLLASAVSQADFRFVAWADNRPGTIDAVPSTGTNRARFQWMLTEMNRLIVQPGGSMVPMWHIVPGDFDETETTEADLPLSGVSTWAFAPGNHDLTELWRPNTSWDHENAHFVFLNEYCCGDGRICDHVYNWLLDDLNSNTQPAIFVVGHEPAFPENAHVGDSLDAYPEERDRFWQLLRDRGVIAYICGHTHVFSTETVDGVLQIDAGNAGNPVHGEPSQTFVVFDVTPDYVSVDVYSGNENQPYGWTDDLFVLPIPEPVYTAHNPSPVDGALAVPLNTALRWTAGSGAVAHDVYLSTGSTPVLVSPGQPGTTYAPLDLLDPETYYYWRIDEYYTDDPDEEPVAGDLWTFETGPATHVTISNGETPVDGIVSGTYVVTQSSDDSYETIQEVLNVPNKNGYSMLEHIWTFDVPAMPYATFFVEAHHDGSTDGDSFEFSYSTNGTTFNYLLTVSQPYSDAVYSCALPDGISGIVYIKVTDTDQTKAAQDMDILFVDHMYILGSYSPSGEPPANQPPVANAGPDQTVTDADEDGSETVTLDGSGSYDPELTPLTYAWMVDGATVEGAQESTLSYSFPVGVHTVTLIVTDAEQASASDEAIITVQQPPAGGTMHVVDLDGAANLRGSSGLWAAVVTVTIADSNGSAVSGATVTGAWGDPAGGTSTGTTGSDGTVTLNSSNMKSSNRVTFTVTGVTHSTLTYDGTQNSDPDGDSDGTVIEVAK